MTTNEAKRIILVPYDTAWPELAARGQLQACGAAGADSPSGATTHVEHVGSTSIPGCAAKPVVDLMPARVSFEAGGACRAPRRHHFVRYADASDVGLTEHVHMYTPGEGQWGDHIAFRDYPRAHDEERDEYVALRRALAERHAHDGVAYTDAKSDFVQRILRLACNAPTAEEQT